MSLTQLPFDLPGTFFRSPMPFSAYDPDGDLWRAYRRVGVEGVVVLTPTEEALARTACDLPTFYRRHGLEVLHFPIPDLEAPAPAALHWAAEQALAWLRSGRTVAAHCFVGRGRTGLLAACMARLRWGWDANHARAWLREYIPGAVETEGQFAALKMCAETAPRPPAPPPEIPRWLAWARQIQAEAQTGLHYAENPYQQERFRHLMALAEEITREAGHLPPEPVHELFTRPEGYATPRVDVRAAVFDAEGRILLVRDASDGRWCLPGGWADVGDTPSGAAEREVLEEAGFRVKARRLIGVYDANRVPGKLHLYHAFKVAFLCDLLEGEARPSIETTDVAFFAYDDLPTDLSPYRTPRRLLEDAFAAARADHWETVFD